MIAGFLSDGAEVGLARLLTLAAALVFASTLSTPAPVPAPVAIGLADFADVACLVELVALWTAALMAWAAPPEPSTFTLSANLDSNPCAATPPMWRRRPPVALLWVIARRARPKTR